MPIRLDATHDPQRRSWIASACDPLTEFPVQNLPFGLFGGEDGARAGVAIGTMILDLGKALEHGLLHGDAAVAARMACTGGNLNTLVGAGLDAAEALREGTFALLAEGGEAARAAQAVAAKLLVDQTAATMLLPVQIGGFSDFFCSLPHAERMGRINRPDRPLAPNFTTLPVGYNGRASSVAISGTALRRPWVQHAGADGAALHGPSTALDYELELGAYLVGGNRLGETLTIQAAAGQLFGYTLLNDWSARDLQRWESLPLGPFMAKSVLTTVSPWIVTEAALAPFRSPAPSRPAEHGAPFSYLDSAANQDAGAIDLTLEAWLLTGAARTTGGVPQLLSRTKFAAMYWTFAQMVTHHASNGCPLRAGDLIGSGTTSDNGPLGRGCLAEMQPEGPVLLDEGGERQFLADGDEIILRGRAERDGFVSIGFGACNGRIMPAQPEKG
jgi:fumarylacetoacetase